MKSILFFFVMEFRALCVEIIFYIVESFLKKKMYICKK